VETPLFHLAAYRRTLELGTPDDRVSGVPLITRGIPGTRLTDAVLTWPYAVDGVAGLCVLAEACPDLVSVVGNLDPLTPPDHVECLRDAGIDAVAGKLHYVLDPVLPLREWSASTRSKIRRSLERWSPVSVGPEHLGRVLELYRSVVGRRDLGGTFWDLPDTHFDMLLRHPHSRAVGMVDDAGTLGAVLCLVERPGSLHALHMAGSDEGQRSWAMYGLLAEVVQRCRDDGTRLLLGGAPRGSRAGSEAFKSRWANTMMPTTLVRLVVDRVSYERLPSVAPDRFFPAYRAAW